MVCIGEPLRICVYTQPSLILLFHVLYIGPSFWEKKELLFLMMQDVEKKEQYRINI